MAGADRSARSDVIRFDNASSFNFFQLVELLCRLECIDQEALSDCHPKHEKIRFTSAASLGFPASDVFNLEQDSVGRHQLEVAFLGLQGSQSPLPGYYLDELAWDYAQGAPKLGLFLDFFHHRLLMLLHRSWRKYRYHVRFQHDGGDGFSRLMFALVGLSNSAVRENLPINRAKMLSYAGMLASPSRSPQVIAGLVSHCFDLDDVKVMAWQPRKVAIHTEQQNRLGNLNTVLGNDLILGASVNDCAGKFLLQINKLSFSQFLSLLPNGSLFQPLAQFVSFILRDQLAWDLCLSFGDKQACGLRLGDEQSCRLGWSSFLGQPPHNPNVTICMQE